MPTTLGTALGTNLGSELADFTRAAWDAVVFSLDQSKMYVLSGFSAANTYKSPAGGGESGDAAGFGAILLGVLEQIPATGTQGIALRQPAGQGYSINFDASSPGFIYSAAASGTGVSTGSRLNTGLAVMPSDVGKVLPLVLSHTGTTIGTYTHDATVKRSVAVTGYTPAAAGSGVMQFGTGGNVVAYAPFSMLTYRGVPTETQLQAVLRAARTAGSMPTKAAAEALMPGTTVTHRWSLRDTLVSANRATADGAVAPATIVDSVTGASIDALGRNGAPVVRVKDPATPKLWSYEVTPVIRGATTFSAADYFESATGFGETAGQSFWFGVLFLALGGAASKSRGLFSSLTSNSGWELRSIGATSGCYMAVYDTSTTPTIRVAPTCTYSSSDRNKLQLYIGVWDATELKIRSFWKRDEVGTGTTIVGYTPSAGGVRIGRNLSASENSADFNHIYGCAFGIGLPTLTQIQAMFDETLANERIGSIPGMTSFRVDIAADIAANGNAMPATLTDRSGTKNFARVGAPTVQEQYARAFNW